MGSTPFFNHPVKQCCLLLIASRSSARSWCYYVQHMAASLDPSTLWSSPCPVIFYVATRTMCSMDHTNDLIKMESWEGILHWAAVLWKHVGLLR